LWKPASDFGLAKQSTLAQRLRSQQPDGKHHMSAHAYPGAAKRAAVARFQLAHLLARAGDQDGAQPLFKLIAEAAPRRSQAGQSLVPQRRQQLRHPITAPGHQPTLQAQALAGTQIVYQQRDLGP
jgi:hypothetical protein